MKQLLVIVTLVALAGSLVSCHLPGNRRRLAPAGAEPGAPAVPEPRSEPGRAVSEPEAADGLLVRARPPLRLPLLLQRAYLPPPTPYAAGHRGLDLTAPGGDTVFAVLPGRVTFAGPVAGIWCVTVDHGDRRTTYQPVRPGVVVGQRVEAGASLGALTPYRAHCPGCLHLGYEVRPGDRLPAGPKWVYADPAVLVRRWLAVPGVRLYPT